MDSHHLSPVDTEGIGNLTTEGRHETASLHPSCTHGFLPNLKRFGAQQSIMDRLHEVVAETKEILCQPVKSQKPLSM